MQIMWLRVEVITYTTATNGDNDKSLKPTTDTDDPHQTNKQDHSEDVLDAREIDTKNRTKLPRLLNTNDKSKQCA